VANGTDFHLIVVLEEMRSLSDAPNLSKDSTPESKDSTHELIRTRAQKSEQRQNAPLAFGTIRLVSSR
jgi:hypothetical protein